MFPTLFSFTLFLSYSYFYSCLQIKPPDSLAILNNEHYFQCEMLVTKSELRNVARSSFTFASPSMDCNVTNWIFCNLPFPDEPSDGYCSCTSKTGTQTYIYIFTFYRKKMLQIYNGQSVTCTLGGNYSVHRQTTLHEITRKPGPKISVCDGHNLTFNWGFGFTYDFSLKYRVVEVSWKTPDYHLLKCVNTNNYTCKRGVDIGETEISWVIPHQSANHDLPKLVYHNVPKAMRNTEVTIFIVFECRKAFNEGTVTGRNELKRRRHLNNIGDLLTLSTTTVETTELSSIFSTTTRRPTTTATTKTTPTTTTTSTTTTPAPVNLQIGLKKQYVVSDSTKMEILEPPSESMGLEFSGTKSFTGQVIVSCELNKAAQLGEPPVNMTIWHNDKVIVTREKTYLLRYMINIDKGNLTCGIVGESALCHGESFLEDLKKVLDAKEIKAELEAEGSIDYNLLLYMAESLTCLVLMMVTIGLVIEHISTILRRRKRLLELQLEALNTKRSLSDDSL